MQCFLQLCDDILTQVRAVPLAEDLISFQKLEMNAFGNIRSTSVQQKHASSILLTKKHVTCGTY